MKSLPFLKKKTRSLSLQIAYAIIRNIQQKLAPDFCQRFHLHVEPVR